MPFSSLAPLLFPLVLPPTRSFWTTLLKSWLHWWPNLTTRQGSGDFHQLAPVASSDSRILYSKSPKALWWVNLIDCSIFLENNHRFKEDPEYGARFNIPEKFLPVAGTESSRNRNVDQNFNFIPVISRVFMCHRWLSKVITLHPNNSLEHSLEHSLEGV